MRFVTLILAIALVVAPRLPGFGELYYNQQENFSIDAPAGWAVTKSAQQNTIIKFVHRDAAGKIAVLSIAAYQESKLGAVLPLIADSVYATFTDEFRDVTARRIASGTAKIRSMAAVWNLIEVTDPPQVRLIGKHYHLRRNGKLWRVSAMTDGGTEFFETILPVMEKSIATLAFGL